MATKAVRARNYQWFLEPVGDEMNWQIEAELAAISEGDIASHIMCADGVARKLLPCSEQICKAAAVKRKVGRDINVFRKEGRDGKPQNVNFLFCHKKPKTQKVMRTGAPAPARQ